MAILQLVFLKRKIRLGNNLGAIKYLYSFGISLLPLTALISALGQTPSSQHLVINGIIVISVLLAAIIILAVLEYIMIRKSYQNNNRCFAIILLTLCSRQ